jgi:LEA14-like dessication related protein
MPQRYRSGFAAGALSGATAALLTIAAALLCGCATEPKLEPPRVSVAGVQFVSGELWLQHLKVRLHLHNPNDRDLPVKGLEYTIEIAGQEVAAGSSAQTFLLPLHGDAELDTHVTANLAGSVLKLLTHIPGTLAAYRLSGKVSLGDGLGRIPFEEHASFSP